MCERTYVTELWSMLSARVDVNIRTAMHIVGAKIVEIKILFNFLSIIFKNFLISVQVSFLVRNANLTGVK